MLKQDPTFCACIILEQFCVTLKQSNIFILYRNFLHKNRVCHDFDARTSVTILVDRKAWKPGPSMSDGQLISRWQKSPNNIGQFFGRMDSNNISLESVEDNLLIN